MKAGDIVEHLGRPELGAGKIISFQSHLGTMNTGDDSWSAMLPLKRQHEKWPSNLGVSVVEQVKHKKSN